MFKLLFLGVLFSFNLVSAENSCSKVSWTGLFSVSDRTEAINVLKNNDVKVSDFEGKLSSILGCTQVLKLSSPDTFQAWLSQHGWVNYSGWAAHIGYVNNGKPDLAVCQISFQKNSIDIPRCSGNLKGFSFSYKK